MAVTTYDPATVDVSDIPGAGYAYDDPYTYPSHSNRIVSAKELTQLWAIASRGRNVASITDRGLGARGGTFDGIGRESYSLVLTKTDNFAIQTDMPSNMLILMNVSTTGKAVTLPNPRGVKPGWTVTVKKINSSTTNTVGVNRKNSETIEGRSANDVLISQYAFAVYMTDGANWLVLGASDFVEATASAGSFAATTVYKDMTSISLSPGVWDVSLNAMFVPNTATVTRIVAGIGTVTGNDATGLVSGDNLFEAWISSTQNTSGCIPPKNYVISTTTTLYAKLQGTFTVATPQYYARLSGRRVR